MIKQILGALFVAFAAIAPAYVIGPPIGQTFCTHGSYPNGPIVAYGDSLTEGYSAHAGCGYALVLQDMVHRTVLQVAQGGYRVDQMLPRLPEVVADHPALVIVELGTNDERWDDDTAAYQRNLLTIFAALRGTPVVCLTIWPSPGHDSPAELFRYNEPIYANCPGPVVDITSLAYGIYVDGATWHPTDAGHWAIAQSVARAIRLWYPRIPQ